MSAKQNEDDTPTITDLDELFRDWARDFFERGEKRDLEKRLNTKLHWEDLQVTLDYSGFFTETEDYDHKKLHPMKSAGHVVFKTTYSNTTSSTLEYTLNTERTTRNITTMRLSKGLTHSGSVGLKLKLPGDVCELEGGYSREVTMERGRETSREEEMVWSANTVVKVPPKTNTTMELVVQEQEYDGTFECSMRLFGKVVILLHKGESEILRIVAKKFNDILPARLGFVYDHEKKSVSYRVRGACLCRKGLEQSIKLSESPIA